MLDVHFGIEEKSACSVFDSGQSLLECLHASFPEDLKARGICIY
jgi:hypothetical protein